MIGKTGKNKQNTKSLLPRYNHSESESTEPSEGQVTNRMCLWNNESVVVLFTALNYIEFKYFNYICNFHLLFQSFNIKSHIYHIDSLYIK